jgi:hypothetical protein
MHKSTVYIGKHPPPLPFSRRRDVVLCNLGEKGKTCVIKRKKGIKGKIDFQRIKINEKEKNGGPYHSENHFSLL